MQSVLWFECTFAEFTVLSVVLVRTHVLRVWWLRSIAVGDDGSPGV